MPIRGVIRNKSQIKRLKHKYPKRRHFKDDYSSSSLERPLEGPPFPRRLTPRLSPKLDEACTQTIT
jgi:hypothetical protein